MNKTIKILITAAFTVGFGSFAKAQAADITANASVISEIVVAGVANLNFGTIVEGQFKTIDSGGNVSVSSGTPLGSANRGAFTVAAQAGSGVTLSFELPSNLAGSNGGTLPISFDGTRGVNEFNSPIYEVYFCRVQVMENGDYTFDPRNAWTFPDGGFPTFQAIPGVNSVNVFLGGEVDATGVAAGEYTGIITLNATYN